MFTELGTVVGAADPVYKMTEDNMKFQRVNVYNRHLPYKDVLDADADAYFAQVSSQLCL